MMKKSWKLLFLWMLTLLFCCPLTAMAARTPYAANGRLSVSEGKIVNRKGKAFVIKGVSTHGLAWYPQYVNEKGFQTLRDHYGVNTIRLALYTTEYHGYCTDGNKKELEGYIDQGVKAAKKLGMYVILDWHILSDGNPQTYQKQAKAFFQKMTARYAGYGNVLYEICNEPNGGEGSWDHIRSYATSVIRTIRKKDKKGIIIVGTPTWSQDIECAINNPLAQKKNVAYAYHFYAGTHGADMRSRLEEALKKKVPVIVTEFGISSASGDGAVNAAEGQRWMELLDRYQTGRVCWNLSNKKESSAILKSSCTKVSGWKTKNLTETGRFLKKAYTGKK